MLLRKPAFIAVFVFITISIVISQTQPPNQEKKASRNRTNRKRGGNRKGKPRQRVHSQAPKSTSQSDHQFADDSVVFVRKEGQERQTHLNEDDFERARTKPVGDQRLRQNVIIQRDKMEGDIGGFTPAGFKRYLDEINEYGIAVRDGRAHSAVRDPLQRWPDGQVPYAISSYFTREARTKIAEGFNEFQSRTCVRFLPRSTQRNYLYIRPLRGCWSPIGKNGGRQEVSLGEGCFQKGTVLHEIMHALGFFHEQSRNDRDNFVTINWQNIHPSMKYNFGKYPVYMIDNLQTEYDYDSVMHYGKDYFSFNGKETITPRDYRAKIGQRRGFSLLDVERVNRLYNCQPPQPAPKPRPQPQPVTQRPYTPYPRPTNPTPPPAPGPREFICNGCSGCTGCPGCPDCDGCPGCPGCPPCRSVNGVCPSCEPCPACNACPFRGCQTCPACPRCPC